VSPPAQAGSLREGRLDRQQAGEDLYFRFFIVAGAGKKCKGKFQVLFVIRWKNGL
jgi:hypothetical protein